MTAKQSKVERAAEEFVLALRRWRRLWGRAVAIPQCARMEKAERELERTVLAARKARKGGK
jgi:hypothetical protein